MLFVAGESNHFAEYQETPVTMGFTHRPARKNAGTIDNAMHANSVERLYRLFRVKFIFIAVSRDLHAASFTVLHKFIRWSRLSQNSFVEQTNRSQRRPSVFSFSWHIFQAIVCFPFLRLYTSAGIYIFKRSQRAQVTSQFCLARNNTR